MAFYPPLNLLENAEQCCGFENLFFLYPDSDPVLCLISDLDLDCLEKNSFYLQII